MVAKEKNRRISLVFIWLKCVLWLQWFVVFFSKLWWSLDVRVFGNTYIRNVVKRIFSSHFRNVEVDYKKYKEILNIKDNFFDQTTHDVILTNRKSIRQAKGIMTKGNEDGKRCKDLVGFLTKWGSEKFEDMQYMDPEKALSQTHLKFLQIGRPVIPLKAERYLKSGKKWSWKLEAVSLINVIVQLFPCSEENSLQVYYEAWELMDLVDEANYKTDGLLSKAADRLFKAIRYPESESENEKKKKKQQPPAATMGEAAAAAADINDIVEAGKAIRALASDRENDAKDIYAKIDAGEDTMEDWEKLAACNALYKLCSRIDCTDGNVEDLKVELKRSLGSIISCCVKNVGPALVDNGKKWAQGLEKRKLLQAIYIAGKSRRLFEELEWSPMVKIANEDYDMVQLAAIAPHSGSGMC